MILVTYRFMSGLTPVPCYRIQQSGNMDSSENVFDQLVGGFKHFLLSIIYGM